MKYLIFKISGKQYKASEGDILDIDKIDGEKGEKINLDHILLLSDGEKISVGQPTLPEVKASAEIIDQFKGDKVRVAKFKAKSRYRRVMGFRPLLTKIKILKIS